jgi:hypothetical protein
VSDEVLCPGWTSCRYRLSGSSRDATGLLVPGRDALGATAGEGWAAARPSWESRRALWSDRPAIYVQAALGYGDNAEVIATEESWRTSAGAVLQDRIRGGRLTPPGWRHARVQPPSLGSALQGARLARLHKEPPHGHGAAHSRLMISRRQQVTHDP